jgi:hypothetical protein
MRELRTKSREGCKSTTQTRTEKVVPFSISGKVLTHEAEDEAPDEIHKKRRNRKLSHVQRSEREEFGRAIPQNGADKPAKSDDDEARKHQTAGSKIDADRFDRITPV